MGGPAATQGAMMMCSFGVAPATLTPLPTPRVLVEGRPAATVTDSVPMANVPSFGMCTSLANPQVASATAAALGVLTPMPCVPATTPWVNGAATTMIGGKSALTLGAQCQCAYGGVVQILDPGARKTIIN